MKALLIVALFSATAQGQPLTSEDKKCLEVASETLGEGEVLFAYSSAKRPEWLDALFVFDGSDFKDSEGQHFKSVKKVYKIEDGKPYRTSFGAYFTQLGTDRCIWFGELERTNQKELELFSFPKASLNTEIDEKTRALFYLINTTWVDPGDSAPSHEPPCAMPILKATSDLNGNGRTEFWYTAPHTWDTGFVVAELDDSGKKLNTIVEKCLDCD